MNKRTHKHEKYVRVYDDEILPIWSRRFGRMLMHRLGDVPQKAMVLDVACGTGFATLELARKVDPSTRIIAIDPSSAMLEVARKKAGDMAGKRIFFRTESATPRLSFANEVYDIVTCNLGLGEFSDPRAALRDFARVTKVGGTVVATLPLRGTWTEFYDIYREVLTKHDKHEMLARLDRHLEQQLPEPDTAIQWMEKTGLTDVKLDVEEFSLLFRSSREFFFAPVVEYGPLAAWKEIAGTGRELQDVFWYIKQAIDSYFGDRAFQVTVKAGCLRGVKKSADAGLMPEPPPEEPEAIELVTGEVDIDELEAEAAGQGDDDGSSEGYDIEGEEALIDPPAPEQPQFAMGSNRGPNDIMVGHGREFEVDEDSIEASEEEIEAFQSESRAPVSIPDLLEGSGFERTGSKVKPMAMVVPDEPETPMYEAPMTLEGEAGTLMPPPLEDVTDDDVPLPDLEVEAEPETPKPRRAGDPDTTPIPE